MPLMMSIVVLFLAQSALAFQPLKMRIQPKDQIRIEGHRGEILYQVNETAEDVAVEVDEPNLKDVPGGDEWQFGFRREGNLIILQVDSPLSKATWVELMARGENAIPSYKIRIIGPSLPTQVNWRDGELKFVNFSNSLSITQVKGSLRVEGGEGDLRIHQQEGSISVMKRTGNVHIDAYQADIQVAGIEGDLSLENFTGDTLINGVKGSSKLVSYKGKTKAVGLNGRLEFTNGIASMRLEQFEGELRGKSLQGPVFASIKGEANVRVSSEEGGVHLNLAGSGAYVNAGTSDGSLQVPNFLRLTRLPSSQIRTGRLRGSNGGSVFVRTTSGNIRIQ